tara:strand:- start:200 stop:643 length:444 start_codon:yes stop_codon:yes gene_type:complete
MNGELPPPPKKGGIHFGAKKHDMPQVDNVRQEINAISTRLRLLEEGFANLRRMSQITEESLLSKGKHYNTEFRTTNSDISDIKKEINEIKDKMLLMIKELQTTAKLEDVKVIDKYVNLWNPIRFVTHSEVDNIVKELIQKSNSKNTK